ncbi:MAG TPA: serine/threonine-protein kinase [Ktedonobacteraceae bacterium]|nr:serine/threonine-protein kinase [Ktedonobacteraceae bacterium]
MLQAQMHHATGPLKAGSLLAGRYHILDKIGEGGFGLVYKARDTRYRSRLVAIKEIDLGTLSSRQIIEATDSYNREVTLLSRLEHRNLPRVYDHFTDPTHWYLVLQYIKGETLEDYLKRIPGGLLPLKEVCKIGLQLSSVFGFLHVHKPPIIFRDVKPANIMRTSRGRLYLIDFGIARRYNPQKSRDTGPLGSPGYAAPEQYGRAQSTEQTDIYGLGATLHTLLTGKEPYEDEQDTSPAQPQDRSDQEFQQLLDKMQAIDPADRPRSIGDVRNQLRIIKIRHPLLRILRLKLLPFLIGLFIGSLPYTFLPFAGLAASNNDSLPFYLIPAALLFYFWPVTLFSQIVTAIILYAARRRLMAIGIIIMLILIYLAILLGWLPSQASLVH